MKNKRFQKTFFIKNEKIIDLNKLINQKRFVIVLYYTNFIYKIE